MIIVVGHRNPDTDAVVSAISFSLVLRRLGYEAQPFVAGDVQPETRIVLEKCGLETPPLIEDVRVRAIDIATKNVLFVYRGQPVKRAIELVVEHSIRSVPIVDEHLRVVGLFSTESFARRFLNEVLSLRLVLDKVPLKNFLEISSSKLVLGSENDVLDGRVYVVAMSIRSVEERSKDLRNSIVVVGDRFDVVEKLLDLGVSTIVLTGGREPPNSIVEKAREKNVRIVVSPHDTYTTLRLLDLSQPVEKFSEPAITVLETSSINEVRSLMVEKGARTIVVVDELGRLRGIVTRSDMVKDYRKRVAMVDHNEFSQSVEGIEEARIVAVVDHHRVSGDVESHEPMIFRVEPVGSTNTIVWRMGRELGVEFPKNVAEAMLYAILSDTMLLKSPTTTDIDRRVANEIASYVGIDLRQALEFMRIAMAANEPSNPMEIATRDLKIFEYEGIRFGIAQVFTSSPGRYLSMARRILDALESVRKERGLDLLMLMVTDFVEERSFVTAVGRKEIVEQAFGIDLSKGFAELKGVTSRKSQVLPRILEQLTRSKTR